MRPELQAKLLQHLNKKKADQGFTLVELLVVIVIIGILAAVALPNFLSQSAKAKQSEAKQSVSIFNRTQTAYRSDKTQFAPSFNALAVGSLRDGLSTAAYSYTMTSGTDATTITAASLDSAVKPYNGAVTRFNVTTGDSESVVASVVCESKQAKTGAAGTLTATGGSLGARPQCDTSLDVDLLTKS